MLYQKSKALWNKDGDMNSKYFHGWINRRWKTNYIDDLWAGENWIEKVEEVRGEIYQYFKKQFSVMHILRPSLPIDFGQQRLEATENEYLSAPFMEDEIRKAV